LSADDWQINTKMKAQGGNNRQADIHCRSRCRNKHHTDTRITKCPKINRHRFGISKQEWRPCEQKESGQENCAKWVYMPERIKADPSKSRRRFISEEAGNISMSGFVKSNGDKNWQ